MLSQKKIPSPMDGGYISLSPTPRLLIPKSGPEGEVDDECSDDEIFVECDL